MISDDLRLKASALAIDAQASALPIRRGYCPHRPHPKQKLFLDLRCEEALYGGMGSGGKTDALLMAAFQYVDVPGYSALILRRTKTEGSLSGSIFERARRWLAGTDARWREDTAYFPSGATVSFAYLAAENDKYRYSSAEFQFIGPDELTHFSSTQYQFMFSRLRRPSVPCTQCMRRYPEPRYLEMVKRNGLWVWDHEIESDHPAEPEEEKMAEYGPSADRDLTVFQIPLRMRAGTNPGAVGHAWVQERFIPDDFRPEDAAQMKVWSKDVPDSDSPEDADEDEDKISYVTTYFVPARKEDNPYADSRGYDAIMKRADHVTREQVGRGNWSIRSVGRPFFTTVYIDRLEKIDGQNCELIESSNNFGEIQYGPRITPRGVLTVFHRPYPGHRYVMGSDAAKGRDRNKGKGKVYADYSAVQIFDLDSGEQVARLRGRITETHLGEYLYRLHRWYNLAYLVPSVTGNYGMTSLCRALDLGMAIQYCYFERDFGKPGSPVAASSRADLGFIENGNTRMVLYNRIEEALTDRAVLSDAGRTTGFEIRDAISINELYAFEWNKEGRPQAREGAHDDTVTALGLVLLGIRFAPRHLWSRVDQPKGKPLPRKWGQNGAVDDEERLKEEFWERAMRPKYNGDE